MYLTRIKTALDNPNNKTLHYQIQLVKSVFKNKHSKTKKKVNKVHWQVNFDYNKIGSIEINKVRVSISKQKHFVEVKVIQFIQYKMS